jgi:hypothetical protein
MADLKCKVIFYLSDGKIYEFYHSNNAPKQALTGACLEYGNLDKVEKIEILREI